MYMANVIVKRSIFKSRDVESGNGMRRMRGMAGGGVEMQGIGVGMRGIWVGMQRMGGGNAGNRVGIR